MRLLEIPALSEAISLLDGIESRGGDYELNAKLEAYSFKKTSKDRKLARSLEDTFQVSFSRSPEQDFHSSSPFGPLSENSNRKLLFELISTLNCSFPSYDFSRVNASQFAKVSYSSVISSVNTALSAAIPDWNLNNAKFWNTIDKEIVITESEIFSFTTDYDVDPFAEEGCIWSLNYFFCNKKVKRIIFFSCCAIRKQLDEIDTQYQNYEMEL